MTGRIAIVGDVHGNLAALVSMLSLLEGRVERVVFVGDYVNRGPSSADVIETLVIAAERMRLTCLAGNHDLALKEFLDGGDITRLLHMGGAPTVLSYVKEIDTDDVESKFRRSVPDRHVAFLVSLEDVYRAPGLIVSHAPNPSQRFAESPYHVFGHVIQRTLSPRVGMRTAAIDTGCGTLPDGRLTALFWPDRSILQLGPRGEVLPESHS